jgi:hypothetical protein
MSKRTRLWQDHGLGWRKPLICAGSALQVTPTGYASARGSEYRVCLFCGAQNTVELPRVSAWDEESARTQAQELARDWFEDRAKDAASL